MDAAYDAEPIRQHSRSLGHVPLIDTNPRRDKTLAEELRTEARRLKNLGFQLAEQVRYNERTAGERVNGRLKDEFGGRHVRVRGASKVMCHCMFGVLALIRRPARTPGDITSAPPATPLGARPASVTHRCSDARSATRRNSPTSTSRRAAGPPEPASSRRSRANGCLPGELRTAPSRQPQEFRKRLLELDPTSDLSNCVYCFMKGAKKLGAVHGAMQDPPAVPGFGPTVGTPSDVGWWRGMEESYGRDLIRENRPRRNPTGSTKIGFFGLSNFNYQVVAQSVSVPETLAAFEDSVLPCECTD